MTIKLLVSHIDETLSKHVTPRLSSTVTQLHDWTGEFSATTVGAPPDSAPPSTTDRADRVKLTKVEADAENPDEARRALVTIYESLDILILETERVARSVNAEMIPTPDHRLQSKLAYVGWQVNQFRRTLPAKSETERLKHIAKLVDELANLCDRFRPPSVRTKPIDVCHAHVRAELETGIDSKYRRWHLCRWCGDFRMTHGVNPPAKLVRLHDRGVQMTTSLLRSAGIVRKPTAS